LKALEFKKWAFEPSSKQKFTPISTALDVMSGQFLNGTSAHNRLFSAIVRHDHSNTQSIKSHVLRATVIVTRNIKQKYCSHIIKESIQYIIYTVTMSEFYNYLNTQAITVTQIAYDSATLAAEKCQLLQMLVAHLKSIKLAYSK